MAKRKVRPNDKLSVWAYTGGFAVVANKVHIVAEGLASKAEALDMIVHYDRLSALISRKPQNGRH